MDLRQQITYNRKKRKISRKKLAEMVGVSESLLSKYEHGGTDISYKTLEGIVKHLDLRLVLLDKYVLKKTF